MSRIIGATHHTEIDMTKDVLAALSAAAHAKGSMLSDKERAEVYAKFTPPADTPGTQTFTRSIAELLAAQERGYLEHVQTHDGLAIQAINNDDIAEGSPVSPIAVKKNGKVTDSLQKLLAAQRRGAKTVVCVVATLQEELSAN
jgi:hypothetical protein